jgi:hypothetical protein
LQICLYYLSHYSPELNETEAVLCHIKHQEVPQGATPARKNSAKPWSRLSKRITTSYATKGLPEHSYLIKTKVPGVVSGWT